MTTTTIINAAYAAWCKLDRSNALDAGVKREMCQILGCDPHQLDVALTDDVIEEIFCG